MKPLVSILIPAYNSERWIGETLRSALAQTWPRCEVIVVDDGSRDRTAEVARSFASLGVKVATQANQGASAARNHAFAISQGDYIQWLDADDLLAPDKISKQMEIVEKGAGPRTLLSSAWAHFLYRPAGAIFVGDMQHDIETARVGGIHSCGVLTGYNTLTQLRVSRPDLIVEHLDELRVILENNAMQLRPTAGALPSLPIATVGALIRDHAGRVLMVRTRKWSNLWGIPGGKIKRGETSPDALRREVREETNLELDDVQFVMVQDCIDSPEFLPAPRKEAPRKVPQ